MSEQREHGREPQRIARTKAELPPLKDGYVRVVHLTGKDQAEQIAKIGLDYSQHGMLQSTARSYGNKQDVEYATTDPRFRDENFVAVVFDIPMDEHRQHETIGHAPGRVDAKYLVGIIKLE